MTTIDDIYKSAGVRDRPKLKRIIGNEDAEPPIRGVTTSKITVTIINS